MQTATTCRLQDSFAWCNTASSIPADFLTPRHCQAAVSSRRCRIKEARDYRIPSQGHWKSMRGGLGMQSCLLTCLGAMCSGGFTTDPVTTSRWPYSLPPPLKDAPANPVLDRSGTGLWQPTLPARPAACDTKDWEFPAYRAHENHPCNFLKA